MSDVWSEKNILVIGAHFDDPVLGCSSLEGNILVMSEKFEPGAMNTYKISELADFIRPFFKNYDIVFTHWPYDWNSDHKVVAQATLIAARRLPITIFFYEVLSSTEQALMAFKPNTYISLTRERIDKKCCKFEDLNKASNLIRNRVNIIAWARMRGIECGHTYAEAFILFRQIL